MPNSNQETETAIDVIGELLRINTEISELCVFEPRPVPLAQTRLGGGAGISAILKAGLKLRDDLGLPFWDSVLVSSLEAGAPAFPILEEALFHNAPPHRVIPIARADWSRFPLTSIAAAGLSSRVLVLKSRLKMRSGEIRHIPMLDFHCSFSSQNRELASRVSTMMDSAGGYLLHSGRSFHFYGKSLMTEQQLPSFLGRALLLSPIVDRAWIAHQLIEGACGLRITPKVDGESEPHVIQEIEAVCGSS